jgi:hypothetical protein
MQVRVPLDDGAHSTLPPIPLIIGGSAIGCEAVSLSVGGVAAGCDEAEQEKDSNIKATAAGKRSACNFFMFSPFCSL